MRRVHWRYSRCDVIELPRVLPEHIMGEHAKGTSQNASSTFSMSQNVITVKSKRKHMTCRNIITFLTFLHGYAFVWLRFDMYLMKITQYSQADPCHATWRSRPVLAHQKSTANQRITFELEK